MSTTELISARRPVSGGQNVTAHDADGDLSLLGERPALRPGVSRLLLFFAVMAAMAVTLHLCIHVGLRRIETSKFGTMNRMVNGTINASLIINGSSRALNHYNPLVLESVTGRSAYNLGMNASQTDVQQAILRTYLDNNTAPELVVQNLDLFTFELTKAGEVYDPGLFAPYLDQKPLFETLVGIDGNVRKWKFVPLYAYSAEDMRFTWMLGLARLAGFNPAEDYLKGFNPRYQEWTGAFDEFRTGRTEGVTYGTSPEGILALERLVVECRSRGIAVVLVYSPEYIEMQEIENNRAEIFRLFRTIAERHSVPLWDFSTSPICLDRQYFYNSQHLNARGADVFSQELAVRVQGLLRTQRNNPPLE